MVRLEREDRQNIKKACPNLHSSMVRLESENRSGSLSKNRSFTFQYG